MQENLAVEIKGDCQNLIPTARIDQQDSAAIVMGMNRQQING